MGLGGERGKLTRQLPHIRAGPHRFGRGISRERRVRIGVHSLRKCLAGITRPITNTGAKPFITMSRSSRIAMEGQITKLYIDLIYSTRVEIINFGCA